MLDIGGSQFDGLGATIRRKRSQTSRRPRPEPQLFCQRHDLSPLSSIPVSDDLNKVSSDENTGDANFRGKMFYLNHCMSRGPLSSRIEDDYPYKKMEEEDGGSGVLHNNGALGDGSDYGQTVPCGNLGMFGDGMGNENKLKKVKLKVGGATRTSQTKSSANGLSNGKLSTKTAQSSDAYRARQKLTRQDTADDSSPDNKSGLQGILWKEFSRGRFSLGEEDMGKMAAKNGFEKPGEKLDPVRKSKRGAKEACYGWGI